MNVTLSVSPGSISVSNKYGDERIVPGKYNLYLGDYQNKNYADAVLQINGNKESISDLSKKYGQFMQNLCLE